MASGGGHGHCAAVAEVAAIIPLVPGTTVIDTGALLITGFLAGLLMGFRLKSQAR
jgi:uncharacterized membrane protein YjjB (DUF3815 family)